MFFSFNLLAIATILLSSVSAAPAADAKGTTTSCGSPTTTTAKFDKLATNAAVPAAYAAASYNDFTVQESKSQFGLNPHSSPNVIVSVGPVGSSISDYSGGIVIKLVSFQFACLTSVPDGTDYFPESYGVQVISQSATPLYDLQLKGTYHYDVNVTKIQEGYMANMTKVDLELVGTDFYFNVVSGASNTLLVLDDVVMIQTNNDC